MPAKKKYSLINKQKRLIATRLMQISLLVEDYLYHQKPLSERSAVAYINEISAYKDKCYRDVRSLQVIEKLTRCMKGIINEQQEYLITEDHLIFPFQDIPKNDNAISSPVYSTADEDLTQLSFVEIDGDIVLSEQIYDTSTDSYKMKEKGEIETREVTAEDLINNSNEGIEIDVNKNITENFNDKNRTDNDLLNDDINLCDDDIDEFMHESDDFRFHHEPELNIQKATSNLSIRDIEESLISQECSQSILDGPAHNTSKTKSAQRKDIVAPLTRNYDVTATVKHQKPATEITFEDKLTKIILPTTKPKINVSLNANKPIPVQNMKTQIMLIVPKSTKETKIAKAQTKKRNCVKNRSNAKEPFEKATSSIRNTTVNNKKTKAKAVYYTTHVHKKDNVKANETKQLTQDKAMQNTYDTAKNLNIQSENDPYQANNTKTLTYSKTQPDNLVKTYNNKETIPIYNRPVVDDLSWIENIRFVREVQSEEYEAFTVDEVFWENYNLPDNWNEDDFNY